jgi:hypothetical protein
MRAWLLAEGAVRNLPSSRPPQSVSRCAGWAGRRSLVARAPRSLVRACSSPRACAVTRARDVSEARPWSRRSKHVVLSIDVCEVPADGSSACLQNGGRHPSSSALGMHRRRTKTGDGPSNLGDSSHSSSRVMSLLPPGLLSLDSPTAAGYCPAAAANSFCESPSTPRASSPIAWFHPPKTGTSFGTLLVHLANASLPARARMSTCTVGVSAPHGPEVSLHSPYEPHVCIGATDLFAHRFPYDEWFRGIFWGAQDATAVLRSSERKLVGGYEICSGRTSGRACSAGGGGECDFGRHSFVCEMDYSEYRGRFFGLWRTPAQLTASNFVRMLDAAQRGGAQSVHELVHETQLPDSLATLLLTAHLFQERNSSDPGFVAALRAYAQRSPARVTRMLAGATVAARVGAHSRFPVALDEPSRYGLLPPDAPSASPLLPLAKARLDG